MKSLLPLVLVFVAWLAYELKKHERLRKQPKLDYLEREQKANLTRRNNIDNLDYITIPLDTLPFFEINDEQITKFQTIINNLSKQKILNLSGFSNTDLKLQYGSANLTILSEYDNNFATLANALCKWGERLLFLGYEKEAITVLEYGISCGTDLSNNYYLLAKYYKDNNMTYEINRLIGNAATINSLMKPTIISNLKQIRS